MFGFGSSKRNKRPLAEPEFDLAQETMPRGGKSSGQTQIDEGGIPSARWLDAHSVTAHLRYDPDRFPGQMLLGESGGVLVGTRPRYENGEAKPEDRHLLTVAGSRAGKSVSMIVPNLLDYSGSALISDPKAELANITALRRAEDLGQAVFVLDPFGKAKDWVRDAGLLASFNPLAMLTDPETLVEDADLIADALVIQSGNDPHWDESAKRFLQGLILHVATFPRYGRKRNLCTVRDLLNFGTEVDPGFLTAEDMAANAELWSDGPPPKGLQGLIFEMRCNPAANNVANAAACDLADKPDKERDSILSSARRQTSFLDLPRMRTVLTEGTFPRTIPDLDVLKTAPGGASIYLCLPAGYMRICSRWLRLFVDLALKAMERREAVKAAAPVLFCLDEFPVLGYMPQLEAAAGQLAGFGVRLWPIVQDLTQLKALYGERWETFIGNAAVVQFFGNSDLTTLKYMTELTGKVAVRVKSSSKGTFEAEKGGATGTSISVQSFDLLPVHEARTVFDRDDEHRRQLLIYQGLGPIVASRIRYFEDETGFPAKIRENLTAPLQNTYNHYMGLDELHKDVYEGDPNEMLGRFITDAFGNKQNVIMPKIHWDYFDWLLSIGADMEGIVVESDMLRENSTLGESLQFHLHQIYQHREHEGLPRPSWMPALQE